MQHKKNNKMRKTVVRQGVFETNSSSTHSLSVASKDKPFCADYPELNKDGKIVVTGRDFDWEEERYNDVVTKMQYLCMQGMEGEVRKALWLALPYLNGFEFHKGECYIDHQSWGITCHKDEVFNFLFNKNSWLYLGNDNGGRVPKDVPLYKENGEIIQPSLVISSDDCSELSVVMYDRLPKEVMMNSLLGSVIYKCKGWKNEDLEYIVVKTDIDYYALDSKYLDELNSFKSDSDKYRYIEEQVHRLKCLELSIDYRLTEKDFETIHTNGNAEVVIAQDGTRTITFEDELQLEYPLNIDIRVSTYCSFGQREDGREGVCKFCHESASQLGQDCDYNLLPNKISDLPKGTELAIGVNRITSELEDFIEYCSVGGYICNVTVNQGHLKNMEKTIQKWIDNKLIKGLGISYRHFMQWQPNLFKYENTVLHVIAGIDYVQNVIDLKEKGVRKILILGEKDFGFNKGKVDLSSYIHTEWRERIREVINAFEIVSFDNLALEQLDMENVLTKAEWDRFYQGEHSMYINAVDKYFAPSSRSNEKTSWDSMTIKEYFSKLNK